jgi:phosphoribosyl 1,2-cyclic phosphate phosphodiesterase
MQGSLTFLGTGTSMGVPTLGCGCAVCTSADPHDRRLRPSVLIRWNDLGASPGSATERVAVIDTGPDFREQALRTAVSIASTPSSTPTPTPTISSASTTYAPSAINGWRESGPIPLYASA